MSLVKLSFILKKKLPESYISPEPCSICGVQGCTDHDADSNSVSSANASASPT